MGTTSDKLTYLNTTKQKLKDSINALGGDITSETTFRNYATELDNIYTNLPKTTGEGSNLSLTTLKGRINVDDILGDTQQDSTTGKNVFIPKVSSGTRPTGLSYNIHQDGTFEALGTISGDAQTSFILSEDVDYTNYFDQDMTLSCGYATTGNIGAITCTLLDENKTLVRSNVFNIDGGNSSKTINLSSTTYPTGKNIRWTFYIPNNMSGTTINIKGKMQLEKGSSVTSFEPYTNGASPNPTYPQDINVVTGTQEVVVQNKNLLDLTSGTAFPSGVNLSNLLANSLTLTGTSAWSGSAYIFPNFEKNTSFTISGKFLSTLARTSGFTIYGTNAVSTSSMTSIIASTSSLEANTQKTYSATFNSGNYDYICIRIWNNYTASALSSSVALEVSKLQLEKGSTTTSYVEHQEQTKTLNLGDIELCKIGNYVDRISKSSGKNLLDISKFEEHYTIDSNGLPAYNGGQTRITNTTPINVEGIDKVTLTCTLNGKSFIYSLLKADNTLISRVAGNPSGTTITIGEAKYLYICFYDNATLSNITDAMLNEGSTALPYEPYGSDKWYIEKNIGKLDISSITTGWTLTTYNNTYSFWLRNMNIGVKTAKHTKICNYFTYSNMNYKTAPAPSLTENEAEATTSNFMTLFKTDGSQGTTVEEWLNWLSSHNVIVYCLPETPTYEEITNVTLLNELNEIEKMMSYSGQTNISVNGNLPMILNVSALKGESE